eukprot:g2137.t1
MSNTARLLGNSAIGLLGLSVGGFLLSESLYNVDGGERGVIFDRFQGVNMESKTQGSHLKIPFIQEAYIYDVRTRPTQIRVNTGTKDLQNVNVGLRVLTRPDPDAVPKIHKELGQLYMEKVIPSVVPEVLKAVVAKYEADELLTKREEVSKRIFKDLSERARLRGDIIVDDSSITHCTFERSYAKAVEEKQIANQLAEREEYIVEMKKRLKEKDIILAEGDAESAEMISKALKEHGRGYVEVKKIDTAKEIAKVLHRNGNVTYLPGGGAGDGTNILLSAR